MKKRMKIKSASNGWIVEMWGEKYVYKEGEEYYMLWDIKNLTVQDDRYDKERIYITRAHGDKYDCGEKNCVLCKRLDAIYDTVEGEE